MKTIEEIRNGKEGQTFDLKSIQIDPKALAIPIVAMANADGGMLAIGISDKTRKVEDILLQIYARAYQRRTCLYCYASSLQGYSYKG